MVLNNSTEINDVKTSAVKMFELWLSFKPKAKRRDIIETLPKPAIAENVFAEEYKIY